MSQRGLSPEQVAEFNEVGYLVVPKLIPREELEPLRQEIADLIAKTASDLHNEGLIDELFADATVDSRLHLLAQRYPDLTPRFMRAIEGKGGGGHSGRGMFSLLTHPLLLDAMESLVGSEIISSSVYRIRPKLPGHVRGEVPWHQDSGYFAPHCDPHLIVTCWIPLVDATIENGCLLALPGAHRQGVSRHMTGGPGGYLVIDDDDLPSSASEAVYLPVPAGGALLLTNLTPHTSRANSTNKIRWSIDLRYQARDVPTNAFEMPEEFDANALPETIACYAPEGDFVVRSESHPESVHSYDQYVDRRARYEAAPLSGPSRGWRPVVRT